MYPAQESRRHPPRQAGPGPTSYTMASPAATITQSARSGRCAPTRGRSLTTNKADLVGLEGAIREAQRLHPRCRTRRWVYAGVMAELAGGNPAIGSRQRVRPNERHTDQGGSLLVTQGQQRRMDLAELLESPRRGPVRHRGDAEICLQLRRCVGKAGKGGPAGDRAFQKLR